MLSSHRLVNDLQNVGPRAVSLARSEQLHPSTRVVDGLISVTGSKVQIFNFALRHL